MSKITYTDKVALYENANIPAVNKVQAADMNEIKSVVNTNADALDNKVNTSDVVTTETTSSTQIYCCDYVNSMTDAESFQITPSYSTISPTYSLQKIGNLVFLNCTSIFLSSISANTWSNIATIPDALKPATSITTAAIMASGDTGNITGHGRCELLTTGTVRVKVNAQQSTPMFTFTLIWTV